MILSKLSTCFHIGVVGVALTMAFSACTDDHFDIQEGDAYDGAATQTLWELISTNPDLSNFRQIAEKTPVFKDEKHPMKDYTFKDVLNGDIVLTVFAPNNEALTANEVKDYEALLQTSPYDVFLRLIGNCITSNRYVATGTNPKGEAERLVLLNNKKAEFDRVAKTIKENGIPVSLTTPNISATNGVLHIIGEQIPFAYNIYEYIRANNDKYKHLMQWMNEHDTLYFNANASAIAGTDPETGEPIYVDSVYKRDNQLYNIFSYEPRSIEWSVPHKAFGFCDLEQEDSIWAMVVPTDAAWEKAVQEMSDWYNYADVYIDRSEQDALKNDNNVKLKSLIVKDTVQEAAISMDIVAPLTFNVRQQKNKPAGKDFWTLDDFISQNNTKLFNTRRDTFTIDEKATLPVNSLIFDGQTPIQLSNGVIYSVDNWNLRKGYGAMHVEVKVDYSSIFQYGRYDLEMTQINDKDTYDYKGDIEPNSFDSNNHPFASKYGTVSKNSFLTFTHKNDEAPKAAFKLTDNEADRQIFSKLEYEVGIVMVPDFYRKNNYNDPEEDPTKIKKNKLKCQIIYQIEKDLSNEKNNGQNTETSKKWEVKFEYDGQRVDTLWLEKTVTFPYSYRNIPKSYPIIEISSDKINSTDIDKKGYQREFSLDRIILRPKTATE